MREYELTYLVSDDVLEKDLKKITDRVAGMISDESGKVSKEEAWGRRKLTYPIKKQNFATYITVWFELPKEKIVDIEHELRVHPQIIRHLIVVKVAKGDPSRLARAEAEKLAVTKEDIVGTEDVEKVLGEKSFEQVEGEKDESYDLMAKRSTTQMETQISTDEARQPEKPKPEEIAKEKIEEKKETVESKPKKKTIKKEEVVLKPEVADLPADAKPQAMQAGEKPVEEPKEEKKDNEADRMKKLDEKLDELLKDDL